VTKSFLSNVNPSNNTSNVNLLFDEFIDGVGPESQQDPEALAEMVFNLRSVYNWNETVPFVKLSAQKCSELLVLTG
jgi:hypothetical protein